MRFDDSLQDFYPFVLSQTVVRKLHFVHARVAPFGHVG